MQHRKSKNEGEERSENKKKLLTESKGKVKNK